MFNKYNIRPTVSSLKTYLKIMQLMFHDFVRYEPVTNDTTRDYYAILQYKCVLLVCISEEESQCVSMTQPSQHSTVLLVSSSTGKLTYSLSLLTLTLTFVQ